MITSKSTSGPKANDYTSTPSASSSSPPSGAVYQNATGKETSAALPKAGNNQSSAVYQNPTFTPDEPPNPHVYQGLKLPSSTGDYGEAYEVVSAFN